MTKTLEQRIAEINLKNYPAWYRERLEAAIRQLGTRWPLHPANTIDLRRKAA